MRKAFRILDRAVECFVVLLFIVMVVVGGVQVFNRFVLGNPLSWSEEVQKYAHIWLIFLTIPICYRRGRHIGMEIVTQKMPRTLRRAVGFLVDLLWLALGLAVAYFSLRIMAVAQMQYSPALEIRMDRIYFGELLGGCYLALNAVRIMTGDIHQPHVGVIAREAHCAAEPEKGGTE